MKRRLQLEPGIKAKALDDIKEFFYNERNEEIGDLAATLILDFILDSVGPAFYNQGVRDSIQYMTEKVDDLYALEIY